MKPLIKLIVTLLLEVSKVWNFNFTKKKVLGKKREKKFPREIQNSIDNVTETINQDGWNNNFTKKIFVFFYVYFFFT